MSDFQKNPFPDLGPKVVNKLLQDHLSGAVINSRFVPVEWVDHLASSRKDIFPRIYIEFLGLEPAPDRQFSGILESGISELSSGSYAQTAQITYPTAYFVNYDVHLQAESLDDIIELEEYIARKIPPAGHLFEIDCYKLAIQRPGVALTADITEEQYFHRIHSYQVESYIFDRSSVKTAPNMLSTEIESSEISNEN